jgi:hypothetical protein
MIAAVVCIVVMALVASGPVRTLYTRLLAGQARERTWRGAALELQLEEVSMETMTGLSTALSGRLGPYGVRFEASEEREKPGATRVFIQGGSRVTLCHPDVMTAVRSLAGQRGIALGDPEFDKDVYVHGPREVVHAVLDAENRGVFRSFLRGKLGEGRWVESGRFEVRDGRIEAMLPDYLYAPPAVFAEGVAALVALARRLDPPADLPARLAQNAEHETLAEVRLHDIGLLAERYADTAVGREALRRACGDGNADVRLTAALGLGEEGRNTLLEIATNQEVNEARASRAIDGLGAHLPLDRAAELLQDALRRGHFVTARACLRRLVESGSTAAEQPLLAVVLHASDELRVFAAEGLGRIGTVAAVLPLRNASDAPEASRELRRVSRQAIAQIQARLSGAEQGQLSLAAEDASGGLSLAAEDSSGQVSLAEKADSPASPKKIPEAQG